MGRSWRQGYYTLKHPEKYKGDPNKVVYRSSWELTLQEFFDNNTAVIEWASEEIAIDYFHPVEKRPAKYYPDFWVKYQDKDGNINIELIEVKPMKQVRFPKRGSVQEKATWAVNMAKWTAAKVLCDKHKIKFRILTEEGLFK